MRSCSDSGRSSSDSLESGGPRWRTLAATAWDLDRSQRLLQSTGLRTGGELCRTQLAENSPPVEHASEYHCRPPPPGVSRRLAPKRASICLYASDAALPSLLPRQVPPGIDESLRAQWSPSTALRQLEAPVC